MSPQKIHVEVGRRRLELSNLNKVLYPEDDILKAQVIEYYLKMAPILLHHIAGRPLSMVRFPDGIGGEQFFQKSRPGWTPDWIDYIRLGKDRKKEYIVAREEATMVWLANLACLEIHQIHSFSQHADKPDYIVFDLDPPEEQNDFNAVKELAFSLKRELENYGYHVFVKTTGGKGLHLLTPIEMSYTFDKSFETAKLIAEAFIKKNSQTTLILNKEARKGRILIDIYRNRPSQTIICPYSLRGRSGAPVSTPLTWEELENLDSPSSLNINTTQNRTLKEGDPWEAIRSWAVPLHTDKRKRTQVDLPGHQKRKTPEQLAEYGRKRDFSKTPEPYIPENDGSENRFVIQRHHASHLHYDLRLEEGGVLKSWALPRGLPPAPGIKRLAVQTEDHPLEYLSFEAEIPKGQYGGGMMWVFVAGRYEKTKEKKNGFYFRLSSPLLNGEYRMHLMKKKEWLLERVDTPRLLLLDQKITPMQAMVLKKPPKDPRYRYEVKWDGIRAIITLNDNKLIIRSRNKNIINEQFPELEVPDEVFRVNNGVFDGEIVCLDAQGKPDFRKVIKRLMTTNASDITYLSKKYPAYCYLFDVLYLDGRSLLNDPWMRRREWLADSFRKNSNYRLSESLNDGQELFDAARKMGMEGIMAKDIFGKYYPDKRTDAWYKIKVKNLKDALIIGYTMGKGERKPYFGGLHMAEQVDGQLLYRGKVGTGFTDKLMKELRNLMDERKGGEKPVTDKIQESSEWLTEFIPCEISYSELTENENYRDPVFKKLRADLL